ncbi:MAG: histidine triad nucleotide-binding protein [Oscillospiraceae bacterium]
MDCLFCKIVAGEIPSTKVFEDETVYVFKDIEPAAPIHYLVIPKKHIDSVAKITPENSAVVAHIFEIISNLAKELNLADGFRVVTNTGDSAGQSVKHLHFHLLSGRDFGWPAG